MNISLKKFQVTKRHALTISRGTSAGSENLLVTVEHEGVAGLGEMAPTSGGDVPETAAQAEIDLAALTDILAHCTPWDLQALDSLRSVGTLGGAARAALDMALYDWQGKRLGIPVWKMLGLDRSRIVTTCVTVGINPPEIVREVVPEILARTKTGTLKVKLGSPAGIEADKAMFAAAQEAAEGRRLAWQVDANGGWSVETAREMLGWLAARGVRCVEQPLLRGREDDLPAIYEGRPLPIYVDESVRTARDVPRLAACVDGVNLKLMKCGGLREALRIIHVSRAHGLKVMMGCMSESTLAITAAAHISPLADLLDLDSHLNLTNDPFVGATYEGGRVLPNDLPGLGTTRKSIPAG